MSRENDLKILQDIFEACHGKTAPVTVQIGYTVDNICREGIVLRNAPPAVIHNLADKGYSLDLREDGLHIMKY